MLVNSKVNREAKPFSQVGSGECFYSEGDDEMEMKIVSDADLIVGRGVFTKRENVPGGCGMSVRLRDGTTCYHSPDDLVIPVKAHVEED